MRYYSGNSAVYKSPKHETIKPNSQLEVVSSQVRRLKSRTGNIILGNDKLIFREKLIHLELR